MNTGSHDNDTAPQFVILAPESRQTIQRLHADTGRPYDALVAEAIQRMAMTASGNAVTPTHQQPLSRRPRSHSTPSAPLETICFGTSAGKRNWVDEKAKLGDGFIGTVMNEILDKAIEADERNRLLPDPPNPQDLPDTDAEHGPIDDESRSAA